MARVGGFQRWRCIVCGEEVVEGQRFLWVPRRGFAHLECVLGLAADRGVSLDPDTLALLLASEAVSYAIVRLKDAERLAGEASGLLVVEQRKRLEGAAAALEKALVERLERLGIRLGGGD